MKTLVFISLLVLCVSCSETKLLYYLLQEIGSALTTVSDFVNTLTKAQEESTLPREAYEYTATTIGKYNGVSTEAVTISIYRTYNWVNMFIPGILVNISRGESITFSPSIPKRFLPKETKNYLVCIYDHLESSIGLAVLSDAGLKIIRPDESLFSPGNDRGCSDIFIGFDVDWLPEKAYKYIRTPAIITRGKKTFIWP